MLIGGRVAGHLPSASKLAREDEKFEPKGSTPPTDGGVEGAERSEPKDLAPRTVGGGAEGAEKPEPKDLVQPQEGGVEGAEKPEPEGLVQPQEGGAEGAEKSLGLLQRLFNVQRNAVDGLDKSGGTRHGNNGFLRFVAVWLGFLVIALAFVSARVTNASDFGQVLEMWNANPAAFLLIVGGFLAVTALLSGLVAHGHVGVSYGRCLTIGVRWGLTLGLIFTFAPLTVSILKWAGNLLK